MIRMFMRNIYFHNRHGVPTNQPVLLASNHPTAFIDPCVLGIFIDSPLYNMTRGDIFRKPFFRRLMESVNMFPVFRLRDGYKGRDRNDQVFEFCRQKLEHKRVVTIYVEGEHHLEYRVRPIQKGIARIAFGTFEKHELHDLQIIPAGCNYVYGDRPRDEVMVNIGAPIYVRDYWEEYQLDPNAATNRLLSDIAARLKMICLDIEDPRDDQLANQLLTLRRSEIAESLLPIVRYQNRRFLAEKAVCNRINNMPEEEKTQLALQAGAYFRALQENGLTDAALIHPEWGATYRLLFFVAGFFPFLLGYLAYWPVNNLARYVTQKTVRKREFVSSVWMGVEHLSSMVYYFLLFLLSLFTRNPWWIALALILPILGWFSIHYGEAWMRWMSARSARNHAERSRLLALRQVLQQYETPVEGV